MKVTYHLLKKYFLLLAGTYLAVRLVGGIVLWNYPDLLTIHKTPTSFTRLPANLLLVPLWFLVNIIIAVALHTDLKARGLKSIPILLATLVSPITGVILGILVMFAADIKNSNYGSTT